ncbi:MAG TPA: ankyrin repeat domain-containing protein [Rhabdochlamydiaceae bacterium]|jgi:hypothetical protein|nr:ankyrin repeat domain-containing protein [Rhabdochlamydiaceae bacterium]
MSFGFKLLLCLTGMLSFISNAEAGTVYTTSILQNEAMDPFVEAIQKEDLQAIGSLIEMRTDVNNPNQYGYTPLMAAAFKGNLEICHLLVGAGADTKAYDNQGATPLFYAFYGSEKESVVRYFTEELNVKVNLMDNSERTPLILAALNNHSKSIELLVAAGAQIETKGEFGGTALYHAVKNGSLEAAKVLLKLGAQLETRDEDSFTPLMAAVFNNNGTLIRFLLKAGADKHARTTKAVAVKVKKDWHDWMPKTVYIPQDASLLDIARQFDKRVAEHLLVNEEGFE